MARCCCVGFAVLFGSLIAWSSANAAIIDLTTEGTSGTINGALYVQGVIGSGTGVFPAFLGIQNNGTESGYNTNGSPTPLNTQNGGHTEAITLGQLTSVTDPNTGIAYYVFGLDINESNPNGPASEGFLSLDELRVFVGGSATATGNTVPTDGSNSNFGALVYQMDAGSDSWVAMKAGLSNGSGTSDIYVYLKTSLFSGHLSSEQIILYSAFGGAGVNPAGAPPGEYTSTDGFEEWAYAAQNPLPPPEQADLPTPEPGSALVWALGISLCAGARKWHRGRKSK